MGSRGAAAALLRLLLLRSSQFLPEPRTVPSPRVGQECVHLPDRGGRRCLELHGDSGKVWGRILEMEERDVNERVVEVADQERGHNEEEEQWIWRNGLLVRVKSRIEVLTKKVDSFNSSIEKTSNTNSPYLKDMMDLNTELTGYFSSLTDNVNIRDLFDFLSICFYEYEHFFKEFRSEIYLKEEERTVLLPLAYDIVYNDIKKILEFINNNTINYTA